MNKNRLKNDILLILILLIAALGGFLGLKLACAPGAYAEVSVNGEVVMTLPLSEDFDGVIGGGGHTNRLIIKGGKASVTEASCPDHLCLKQGEAEFDGESIVCLPNKMIVTIVGGGGSTVDAVAK